MRIPITNQPRQNELVIFLTLWFTFLMISYSPELLFAYRRGFGHWVSDRVEDVGNGAKKVVEGTGHLAVEAVKGTGDVIADGAKGAGNLLVEGAEKTGDLAVDGIKGTGHLVAEAGEGTVHLAGDGLKAVGNGIKNIFRRSHDDGMIYKQQLNLC